MKTVKEVIKKSNLYHVTIDDETISFDPEIVLKYRLKVGVTFDIKDYHQLMNDNEYLIFYKLALKKLKKMMTTYEMKTFLSEKNCRESIIKQILKTLTDKKYIDDVYYVKTYISLKSSSYGVKKLSYELKQKGVLFDLVEAELSKIDELPHIQQLITKKLPSLKNKSHYQTILKLKTYLLQKGFESDKIDHALSKLSYDEKADLSNLKKDFEKLEFKIKCDDPYEKNQKIMSKLYQKGYKIEDIKKIIHS
ncbi:MAG: hypothetical protein EP317_04235 [Bacillota bacterium]|nr:MAG: hypothetical protein EP317_04235 [Bacillota bacterium]